MKLITSNPWTLTWTRLELEAYSLVEQQELGGANGESLGVAPNINSSSTTPASQPEAETSYTGTGVTSEAAYRVMEQHGLEGAMREKLDDTPNIIVSNSESQPVAVAESSGEVNASPIPETITETCTTSSLKSVEALVENDALQEDGPPNNEKSQVVEHMEVNHDEDEDCEIQGRSQQIGSSQPEADENNVNEVLNQNSEAAVTPQTVTAQNTSSSMESDEGGVPQPDHVDSSEKSRSIAWNLLRPQKKEHKAWSQKKTAKAPKRKLRSTLKKNDRPNEDTGTSEDGSVGVSSPMQPELHGANQELLEIPPNSSLPPTTEALTEPAVSNDDVDVNINSTAIESQAVISEIGSSQKISFALESDHEGDLPQPQAVETSATKERFNCSICDRTYCNPRNVLRHQKNDHRAWYKRQLKAHKKTSKHPKEKKSKVIPVQTQAAASLPSSKSGFYCSKCTKRCANRWVLMRHEGKVHNIWSARRQSKTDAPKEKQSAVSAKIPSSSKSANCIPTKTKVQRPTSPCQCPACKSRREELKDLACSCTNCGQYFGSWAKLKRHQEKEHRGKEQK